ncbi:hypothetical protein [Alkalihalobacillus sp. CinArs1]|uniref:hypothetical protein n=1 Tax=Alkalihalobacillus sp. CinArs1 TaxID=2995314 RepID=UPI0022DD09B8|nr:hypothetical protein [Alkalihalobacillus sp. CinArs1]
MNLQDAMYNWLSIKKVADERESDHAAQDTRAFFEEILIEDHGVSELDIEIEEPYYIVHFVKENDNRNMRFPIELIDALLRSIQNEPKYNQ